MTTLFDPPGVDVRRHVRRTDPQTSVDAARKAVGNSRLRELVLLCHRAWSPGGLTDNELRAKLTGDHNHGSVAKRRKDLVDAGLIFDSGERRDGQIVWKVTLHAA